MSQVVFEKVCALLDARGVVYTVKTHRAATTAVQAARARGLGADGVRRGAKAMVLLADGVFVQCVVPGDVLVDLDKVKVLLGVKEVVLASSQQVEAATGCVPGSVPPFGNLFNMRVYADVGLADGLVFSAGLCEKSIFMSRLDWERVVQPVVVEIGQPWR